MQEVSGRRPCETSESSGGTEGETSAAIRPMFRGECTCGRSVRLVAMMIDAAWFLAGLVALIFGAEIMVRGGAEVAARLGISPIVIGLTVVSIGTSLPELAVGVVAVGEGSGALAVGNIAGTNVVNLLLILGLSALLVPLAMAARTLRFELPVMAGAAVLML